MVERLVHEWENSQHIEKCDLYVQNSKQLNRHGSNFGEGMNHVCIYVTVTGPRCTSMDATSGEVLQYAVLNLCQ